MIYGLLMAAVRLGIICKLTLRNDPVFQGIIEKIELTLSTPDGHSAVGQAR